MGAPLRRPPIFLARYTLLLSLPFYHFVVATTPLESSQQILGFVIWKDGGGDKEEPEFNPEFPEGADLGLIQYFLGENRRHQKDLESEIGGCAELEVLAVSPAAQRRGIGGLLLGAAVREVDKRNERMYVKSSKVGKGLYEKFGWRVMGEEGEKGFKVELKDYGVEEGYTSWDMMREVGAGK